MGLVCSPVWFASWFMSAAVLASRGEVLGASLAPERVRARVRALVVTMPRLAGSPSQIVVLLLWAMALPLDRAVRMDSGGILRPRNASIGIGRATAAAVVLPLLAASPAAEALELLMPWRRGAPQPGVRPPGAAIVSGGADPFRRVAQDRPVEGWLQARRASGGGVCRADRQCNVPKPRAWAPIGDWSRALLETAAFGAGGGKEVSRRVGAAFSRPPDAAD